MENILCVKLPYPKIKENKRNLRLVSVINRAYAGGHGELKAILQYAYHYLYFKGMGDEQTARIIMGICVCEMKHLNILGDAIISLGGDPVYATSSHFGYNYFSTSKKPNPNAGMLFIFTLSPSSVPLQLRNFIFEYSSES